MEAPGLNVERTGEGPPLVLIHGLGASIRSWGPVIPRCATTREVVAVDLPGFGESPPLPAGVRPTPWALADAVERELDAAGLERPAIAGNSLGGWIALELARRGRAASVVAISPAGMWTERERAWADRFLRTLYAVARRLEPHAELVRNPVARTLALGAVSARPWRTDPEDAVYGVRALARSNFLPTHEAMIAERCRGLEEIACPVLVLWGTRDLLLPLRQARRFADRIPGAALRELPGLGHVPMADDADLVAQALLELSAA